MYLGIMAVRLNYLNDIPNKKPSIQGRVFDNKKSKPYFNPS